MKDEEHGISFRSRAPFFGGARTQLKVVSPKEFYKFAVFQESASSDLFYYEIKRKDV